MKMTLYYGGRILTMVGETKETAKYVEAVVEKDGNIVFSGTIAEAKRQFRTATNYSAVNLEGRTMMPGHIDPHLHPSMASLILSMDFITPFDWDLPSGIYLGVRTEEDYRKRLNQLISDRNLQPASDEFLITWGYQESFHGKLDRLVLDQLNTVVPVVVWQRSFHEVYLNTIALNLLHYDDIDDLKKNPQVDWDRGHFYEMGLDALMGTTSFGDRVFPLMEKGYAELIKVVHQSGITTVGDLEFPLIELDMETDKTNRYLKSRNVYFSTYCIASGRNFAHLENNNHEKALVRIQEVAESFSDKQVILFDNHVKGLCDGAFFSLAMQMVDGYPDKHEGQWITEPEELKKMMEVYWIKDFQIHVHTNGDLGMKELLRIVEQLNEDNPKQNHRTTVEHAGYFTKDQADKIAKLGLLVSAAPYYLYALADKYSDEKTGIGKDRAEAISPLKWLFDNQVTTALHSDFTMAPSQPLVLAWCAVNRVTAMGNFLRKDLRITPYQGMLGITKNASIILGTDDIMGTIEVGKLANFTILEEDPLEVKEMHIKDIKVYASVYKGKLHKIEAK